MTRPSASPQGNPREAKGQAIEVHSGPIEIPPAPTSLSPRAAAVWAEVWAAGGQAYNVRTDAQVIARYAEMTHRREALLATLDAEGWTTVGSQGQIVAHPAAKLLDSVDGKLVALEDRLGLNPESRVRLGIAAVEQKSKLQEFLERTAPPTV